MLLWFESNGSHRHMRVALSDRRSMRATLRARRRAVAPAERLHASRLLASRVDQHFRLSAGRRIALFASLAEEIDTAPLRALAARRGCEIYLPRIERRSRRMRFVRTGGAERRNHLGILEPTGPCVVGARWLDVVFVPLVGFDARGMRLGMGGGFYDRAFAFRRLRHAWRGPLLVGLAYSIQEVAQIEPAAHDVWLDAIVTETGVMTCATGS